jgi:hypothetical protein
VPPICATCGGNPQIKRSLLQRFQVRIGCAMSLRSLLSKLKYPRSHQGCSEETGLIISKRLKDLLASADSELKTAAEQPANLCAGYSKESGRIERNGPNSPAVKTAA